MLSQEIQPTNIHDAQSTPTMPSISSARVVPLVAPAIHSQDPPTALMVGQVEVVSLRRAVTKQRRQAALRLETEMCGDVAYFFEPQVTGLNDNYHEIWMNLGLK